ncbi:MAG: hypothetical protein CMP10_17045 [Zetaproteobacteria bacterium]|nr:hypothetical protein [Pseudobdellovibrionaceae bacterium]
MRMSSFDKFDLFLQRRFVLMLFSFCLLLFSGERLVASTPEIHTYDSKSFFIALDGEDDLGVDETRRLTVLYSPIPGQKFQVTDKIIWRVLSGDAAKLSVDGLLTGLREGRVEIAAVVSGQSVSQVINVKRKPIRIFAKLPDQGWANPYIWYWQLAGEITSSGFDKDGNPLPVVLDKSLGSWPGKAMNPVSGYPGWFQILLPRYDNPDVYPNGLDSQPARLVINNGFDEKTRNFVHRDGCFLPYNTMLAKYPEKVINGYWESLDDCPAISFKTKVAAFPAGGPVYDGLNELVKLTAEGGQGAVVKASYQINGTASSDQGVDFNGEVQLSVDDILGKDDQGYVCLFALNSLGEEATRCFSWYRAGFPRLVEPGATWSSKETQFTIWSPDRKDVQLWLDGRVIPMGPVTQEGIDNGMYTVTVPGNYHLKPYYFLLDGKVVRDPYARMVKGGSNFCIVMDLSQTEPEGGWVDYPPLKELEESIVYEANVRDFTKSSTSGVSAENRGRFLGMVEDKTWLNGDSDTGIKTGIAHLKEMGVTHVQLMPIFDYATCSDKDDYNFLGCYNWGYDPENYNVPEELYAVNSDDPVERIREFKTMINEFHRHGIRVVMDVVYNHTWLRPFRETDEGEDYLSPISKQYFLRTPDGVGYELTGTGNTLDGNHRMVRKMILDSLEYWVREYRIDGFRFDLAGVFDHQVIADWIGSLNRTFPDRKLLTYGEPWVAYSDPDPRHFRLNHLRSMYSEGKLVTFGGFNFLYREALKGANNDGSGGGYVFNQDYDLGLVMNGLRGSIGDGNVARAQFASDPSQTINYVSSHDNLSLWDKIQAWSERQSFSVSQAYKERIAQFANGIVLVSQGIPLLHSGSEFLRSKDGLTDSYKAPDSVNQIDWNLKKRNAEVFDYYKHMIQLRRESYGLHFASQDEIYRNMSVRDFGNGLIYAVIRKTNRNPNEMIILLNSGPDRQVVLPDGRWYVVAERSKASSDRREVYGRVEAEGTAVTVLVR